MNSKTMALLDGYRIMLMQMLKGEIGTLDYNEEDIIDEYTKVDDAINEYHRRRYGLPRTYNPTVENPE